MSALGFTGEGSGLSSSKPAAGTEGTPRPGFDGPAARRRPPHHSPRPVAPCRRWVFVATALLALAPLRGAEPTPARTPSTAVVVTAPQTWDFAADGVTFDSEFSSARLSRCERLDDGRYLVVTAPENRPINPSPWFAFRVRAATPRTITVRVNCESTRLRYVPKISVDGRAWIALPAEAFTAGPSPDEGTLRLEVGPEPLWVAAQEMVSLDALESWSRTLERLPFVSRAEIGRSRGGRPVYQVLIDGTTAAADAGRPGLVVVISRQHPPETTGSLSLMTFIETLLGDAPRTTAFRQRFAVLVIPVINPDGVALGHWRHNLNGVDTNRDWGVFAQPETRLARDAILAAQQGREPVLHLDFHSTHDDVFYTQPDSAPSKPAGFTKAWLAGIEQRVPGYKVNRSATSNPTPTTSHNWAHRTFGIPTITYEVGDNSDRHVLRAVARAAAESMMEQLLASPASSPN